MRSIGESQKLFSPIVLEELFLRSNVQTLTGALTLPSKCHPVQFLDPGGAARDVTLPAITKDLVILIVNTADAAEDITVKNPAAATVGTVSQNEAGLAVCDGVAWRLVLVGTST